MIPTAEEFLGQWLIENTGINGKPEEAYFVLHMLFDPQPAQRRIARAMRAYTELHVKAALEAAKQQVENYNGPNCYDHTPYYGPCVTCGSYDNYELIRDPEGLKDSILTIYPESNII